LQDVGCVLQLHDIAESSEMSVHFKTKSER